MAYSFVTLSRDRSKWERLLQSIRQTMDPYEEPQVRQVSDGYTRCVGRHWELLVMDGTRYDLFQGYNRGAKEAEYTDLIFLHDDVELLANFTALQYGLKLLMKPMTGVVGVAGTLMIPATGRWWSAPQEYCRGMAGHPSLGSPFPHWNVWPHGAAQFGPVAAVDGVFMMMRKRTLDRLQGFDEEGYQGFHFYDLDLSLRATLTGLTNQVVPIPLLHHSHGQPNQNWEENRLKFVEKFQRSLPFQL